MRNEIKLTDSQIEKRFNEFGCTIEDLVFTRDSIEDFMNGMKKFNEIKSANRNKVKGTLSMLGVQVKKGEARSDVFVVDFGSIRAVYK